MKRKIKDIEVHVRDIRGIVYQRSPMQKRMTPPEAAFMHLSRRYAGAGTE
jgi:hypothetical protein